MWVILPDVCKIYCLTLQESLYRSKFIWFYDDRKAALSISYVWIIWLFKWNYINPWFLNTKPIIWQDFGWKLHEKERKGTKRGRTSLAPLRSANGGIWYFIYEEHILTAASEFCVKCNAWRIQTRYLSRKQLKNEENIFQIRQFIILSYGIITCFVIIECTLISPGGIWNFVLFRNIF